MPAAIPPARCILGSRQVRFVVKKRSRPSGASWEQEATMPEGAFYGQEGAFWDQEEGAFYGLVCCSFTEKSARCRAPAMPWFRLIQPGKLLVIFFH